MKRQKRDRNPRAFLHGYEAGYKNITIEQCPFEKSSPLGMSWCNGWREGRDKQLLVPTRRCAL